MTMKQLESTSYLFGHNAPFIEELYENYLADPASVPEAWRAYFDKMQNQPGAAPRDVAHGPVIAAFEQMANPVIAGDRKLINFRYFFTRKVVFVKESHAIVLFPGGFGTHDEGYEALTLIQTGKSEMVPVVYVDQPGGSYWKDWDAYIRSHLLKRGLIGANDAAPATLITLGLGLIGLRDRLERAIRHGEKR